MNISFNEIKENKIKYKPEDLTPDGLPTIEIQIKEIMEKEEKTISKLNDIQLYNREMIQRVKCLSLNKMGKNIMTDTTKLKISDRKKLQEIMHSYNDVNHSVIIDEFNNIISDEILDNTDIDYSKLPIYNI